MQDTLTDDSTSEKRNTFYGWVGGVIIYTGHRSQLICSVDAPVLSPLLSIEETQIRILCEPDETFPPTPSISNGAM